MFTRPIRKRAIIPLDRCVRLMGSVKDDEIVLVQSAICLGICHCTNTVAVTHLLSLHSSLLALALSYQPQAYFVNVFQKRILYFWSKLYTMSPLD